MSLLGETGGAWTAETHRLMYPGNFNHGLARFLTDFIRPTDFLEFGGGTGSLARHVARECRVGRSYVIEPEIPLAPEPGVELEALNIDITKHVAPRVLNRTFDLVLNIEVAEHVDHSHHERLFDFLASRARRWVVFSGARPGQGGHGHVAERPEVEWRDEFVSRGFTFDARLTAMARSMSDRRNINHKRNIQVFLAPQDHVQLDAIEKAAAPYLDDILAIVRGIGSFLDGNLFYVNLAEAIEGRPSHALRWKRENLVSVVRHATRALEVGFNAGHAALLMLLSNTALHVTCVDRLDHGYTRACFDYLATRFPGRIELIPGDSVEVLPRLPSSRFDLIHLDGGKERTISRDLTAARSLVSRDHVLVIDDTHNASLNAIVDAAASRGEIVFTPFAEANARSLRSRWRHRLGRFSPPEPPETAAMSWLHDIYEGSTRPSRYLARDPEGASSGRARANALAVAIRAVEAAGVDGAFVEVGAAAGHSSVLAALMASRFLPRDFYLFDVFDDSDGPDRQSGAVRDRMHHAGVGAAHLMIVEGPAESTVPLFAPERVAILQWNTVLQPPIMAALECMYDRLQPGGWLLVDLDGHGQSYRHAVDAFFERRGETFSGTVVGGVCAVIQK